MTTTQNSKGLLPRDSVRLVAQPALIECGHDAERPNGSITVVPLIDGDSVMGFDVRCGCGSSVVVEFVYPNEADPDAQ